MKKILEQLSELRCGVAILVTFISVLGFIIVEITRFRFFGDSSLTYIYLLAPNVLIAMVSFYYNMQIQSDKIIPFLIAMALNYAGGAVAIELLIDTMGIAPIFGAFLPFLLGFGVFIIAFLLFLEFKTSVDFDDRVDQDI
ncbi:MAG: hypothetical protein GJ680_05825 [Alteromonadaceae bacterium]|nr:hypothetical protein [Alteromonadaceae bacterium]